MKTLLYFLLVLSLVFVFVPICYADLYETEPNNDKSQADALVSGSPIIGQLSLKTDQDWFYLCHSGLGTIQITFYTEIKESREFDITIYDDAGNTLSRFNYHGYGDPIYSVVGVTKTGAYLVEITANATTTYPYTLTVSSSSPGECEPLHPSQYDVTGIWQMVGQNYYFSLYVTGSTAIAVTYIPGAGESYLLGTISGNIGHITHASDLAQFDATFTFTSATTATLTVNKCIPFSGEYCLLPVGVPINGIKVF